MAGYPYTGGIYGGYSDPANNKKKTFIGPKVDNALSSIPGSIRANPDTGSSMVADAGMASGNPLAKTPKGYPNIGFSTTPTLTGTPKKTVGQNPLATPFDMGSAAGMGRKSTTSNLPKNGLAGQPADQLNPLSRYDFDMRQHLSNNRMQRPGAGMNPPATGNNSLPQNSGVSSLVNGTPGQDGYGKLTTTGSLPRPGSTMLNRGVPGWPNAYHASVNSLARLGDTVGTTRENGLEFTGKASDAAKFFAGAPAGRGEGYDSNEYKAQQHQKANPFDRNNPYDDRFSYKPPPVNPLAMISPPPRVMGSGGWKSQVEADKANAAAYGDYTRAMASLAANQNSVSADNYRAGLSYLGDQQANYLAQQRIGIEDKRLGGDLALNDARIASEGINQQKGRIEVDQARKIQALNDQYLAEKDPAKQKALGNQILAIQGKNPKEWQLTMREEPIDPSHPMLGTTKRPYMINLNDPSQIIEVGGQFGGETDPAMAHINANQEGAKIFASMSPDEKKKALEAIRKQRGL